MLERGPLRVADHALAARSSARPRDTPRRRDGDELVPAVSRGQRRHVHGADRDVDRGARSRSPRRGALASAGRRGRRRERRPTSTFTSTRRRQPLNVFGYAAAMRADVSLKGAAYVAAPLALAAGWRAARAVARTASRHDHARPLGGAGRRRRRRCCAGAAARRQPARLGRLCRRNGVAGAACRRHGLQARRRRDRLQRRLARTGARARRRHRAESTSCPTASTPERFRPDPFARARLRATLGIATHTPLVFSAGRLVSKKGFEYLIDALAAIPQEVNVQAAIAGAGDLEAELRAPGGIGAYRLPRTIPRGISRRTKLLPGSRRPTLSPFRRSAMTAATSTACQTSSSKRWRRERR